MQKYIKAELLKQRHTFLQIIIFIAPLITLSLNILAPLWYQQNSYNWWYMIMYPACLSIICILINQRDSGKLKYNTVYLLPINLKKAWFSKIAVCTVYSFISNTILMIFNIFGGLIIQKLYQIQMTIDIKQAITGTMIIFISSIWSIPLCLWLANKIGSFMTLSLNIGLSFVLSAMVSLEKLWILCPYSWCARLMIYILDILPNGEPVINGDYTVNIILFLMPLLFSLLLFYILSMMTAKWFCNQEAK